MSANAFKPSEGKREEFRKYLEKNGVMDELTKVLVNLYEEIEKPEDALEFIRDKLAIHAGLDTYNQMKTKLEEAQVQIVNLQTEIDEIKLSMAPPAEENPEGEIPPEEGEPDE